MHSGWLRALKSPHIDACRVNSNTLKIIINIQFVRSRFQLASDSAHFWLEDSHLFSLNWFLALGSRLYTLTVLRSYMLDIVEGNAHRK